MYPRSGLSLLPTFIGGGVVDSNCRGNISVILTNFVSFDVEIKVGDKIAQIMFSKPAEVLFEEVEDSSDNTVQGTKGFGSTGR